MLKYVFRLLLRSSRKVQTREIEESYIPPTHRSTSVRPRRTVTQSTAGVDLRVHRCEEPNTITGKCWVIDGDTIQIGNVRLRLAGIDAPELEHPWGKKAKWQLVQLCKGQTITARVEADISYDRIVATCFLADGRDLSAEMVKLGLALDWPKFSGGKYAEFEPDGVRKKHWKAAARQRGHMHVFEK